MTCCHYVIFMTYFDNFDRVQGNMNGPEALKSKKTTKELEATKRGAIAYIVTRFFRQRGKFLDCWKRDTIAGGVSRL